MSGFDFIDTLKRYNEHASNQWTINLGIAKETMVDFIQFVLRDLYLTRILNDPTYFPVYTLFDRITYYQCQVGIIYVCGVATKIVFSKIIKSDCDVYGANTIYRMPNSVDLSLYIIDNQLGLEKIAAYLNEKINLKFSVTKCDKFSDRFKSENCLCLLV